MTNNYGCRTRNAQRNVTFLYRLFVLAGALSVSMAPDCVHAKKPKDNESGVRTRGGVPLLGRVRLSSSGIGFDDLLYAPALGRVLAPAANAGGLALIEPTSRAIARLQAPQSVPQPYRGGHDEGMTSADSDGTWVFATDRTTQALIAFNVETGGVVGRVSLAGSPDYVRYVPSTHELWVTEPEREQIEIFETSRARDAVPKQVALLKVPGGPESLVVDEERNCAYTHLWKGKTVVIHIESHRIVRTVLNGCQSSRGIALERDANLLFTGCNDGRVTVLDLKRGGALVSSASANPGVDIIAYNARLRHIYAPSASNGTMAVFSVDSNGNLRLLEQVRAALGSHCVTSDNLDNVWVCDPEKGELLVFGDTRR